MGLTPTTKRMTVLGMIAIGLSCVYYQSWEIVGVIAGLLGNILKDEVQRSKERDANGEHIDNQQARGGSSDSP